MSQGFSIPSLVLRAMDNDENGGLDARQDTPANSKVPPTREKTYAIVAFTSIALYNVLELVCIIFTTFKKRKGLYFISFCVSTFGIVPYSIAFLLVSLFPHPEGIYGYVTMIVIGWSCMVTGQSLVLYSRLHLIHRNPLHLRIILWVIIVDGIVLHTTAAVMIFGTNSSDDPSRFYKPYAIVERLQVTVFFVQELSISLIYIWATFNMFRNSALHPRSSRSRMLWRLIAVNVVVILLDFTILGLEYGGLYKLQTTYKAVAYSVKLKIEFGILNDLVNLTRTRGSVGSSSVGQSWSREDPFRNDSRADSYQPSLSLNTITEGGIEEEQRSSEGHKMKSFKAMATRFTSGRRSANGHDEPDHDTILQTIDTDITLHNEMERPRNNGEA